MPHQIVLLYYLVKRGNAKMQFSLKCCISALREFKQALDFFNLFDSRLILTLLCDSISLVMNAFSYRDCWGMNHAPTVPIAERIQSKRPIVKTSHSQNVPYSKRPQSKRPLFEAKRLRRSN